VTPFAQISRDEIVPARLPWSGFVEKGDVLRLMDLEGQQAVDLLCFKADDLMDRYNAANTFKVQGNAYVGTGTVLYADSGAALFTVIEDTIGRHDTVYGCCSEANNFLRYGVRGTANCYDNFLTELARYGLDRLSIVSNFNFFMQVPIAPNGCAGVAIEVSAPGSYVELRAECAVLVVLSNCPQIHNACNAYNPTPIRVTIGRQ
jgi:urea carboxylase-associated protein 1